MPLLDSSKRRRARTRGTTPQAGPDAPVLYWMSRDQRIDDNWALLRACDVAEAHGAPVVIVCNVRATCLGAEGGVARQAQHLRVSRSTCAPLRPPAKLRGFPCALCENRFPTPSGSFVQASPHRRVVRR